MTPKPDEQRIAAKRQELIPAPVRTLQPGDVTDDGRRVLRVTPLSGRLCVRFEDDDTLWRMHGDSVVWIRRSA